MRLEDAVVFHLYGRQKADLCRPPGASLLLQNHLIRGGEGLYCLVDEPLGPTGVRFEFDHNFLPIILIECRLSHREREFALACILAQRLIAQEGMTATPERLRRWAAAILAPVPSLLVLGRHWRFDLRKLSEQYCLPEDLMAERIDAVFEGHEPLSAVTLRSTSSRPAPAPLRKARAKTTDIPCPASM